MADARAVRHVLGRRLAAAWKAWALKARRETEARSRCGKLMRAALGRLGSRTLHAAVNAWRAAVQQAQGQEKGARRLSRTVHRLTQAHLSKGFRKWADTVREEERVKELDLTRRQVRIKRFD